VNLIVILVESISTFIRYLKLIYRKFKIMLLVKKRIHSIMMSPTKRKRPVSIKPDLTVIRERDSEEKDEEETAREMV
jgi:hypothetical protein